MPRDLNNRASACRVRRIQFDAGQRPELHRQLLPKGIEASDTRESKNSNITHPSGYWSAIIPKALSKDMAILSSVLEVLKILLNITSSSYEPR